MTLQRTLGLLKKSGKQQRTNRSSTQGWIITSAFTVESHVEICVVATATVQASSDCSAWRIEQQGTCLAMRPLWETQSSDLTSHKWFADVIPGEALLQTYKLGRQDIQELLAAVKVSQTNTSRVALGVYVISVYSGISCLVVEANRLFLTLTLLHTLKFKATWVPATEPCSTVYLCCVTKQLQLLPE